MIPSDYEQPRLAQHARHEVLTGGHLVSKFGRRIDSRIHLPAQPFLHHGERMHDALEWRLADDEQIDVAGRAEFAARRRPEHERDLNPIAKRGEALAEEIDEAGRLGKQPAQFRKDRRVAVRLKVHLMPLHRAPNETRGREQLKFTLDGANGGACLADDLPEIVGLVGMPEQPAEQSAPRAAEQDGRGIDAPVG